MTNTASAFSKHKTELIIESVIELDASSLKQILQALDVSQDRYRVVNRPNPALIAGLRIIVDGQIVDTSFAQQLNQLSSQE